MKTYLVTGAAGFIGANYIKYLIKDGTKIYNAVINTNGTTAICGLFIKYFNPKAPNNAGTTLLNAGSNASFCKTGCKGTNSNRLQWYHQNNS